MRLEGEREWKWRYAFVEWDGAASESKENFFDAFGSGFWTAGLMFTWSNWTWRVEQGGFFLLRICPSSLLCPLLLPTPCGSQGWGFHHGHCIKAAGALLPVGSRLVWRLGDTVGLFYFHPTNRLCKPKKSHSNLIWLHLMWFGSVCAGGNAEGIGKAAQKWIWPSGSTEPLSTRSLASAQAVSLPLKTSSRGNKKRCLGSVLPQQASWQWRKISRGFPFPSSFLFFFFGTSSPGKSSLFFHFFILGGAVEALTTATGNKQW